MVGLAGHEIDFFKYVADSTWIGGKSEYSSLDEALPYWFNAMVPLAYALDDEDLKAKLHYIANYSLSHQNSTGWIGPEKHYDSNDIWARHLFGLGLMQLAQADPNMTEPIVSALHKFVPLMNTLLQDGKSNDEVWGRPRYADMNVVLQWLFEYHPSNQSALLLETMGRLRAHGTDWVGFYTPWPYISKMLIHFHLAQLTICSSTCMVSQRLKVLNLLYLTSDSRTKGIIQVENKIGNEVERMSLKF